MTSVSRTSDTACSVMSQVAGNEFNQTVLQLVKLPLSESNTYSLLKIIENLHSLGLDLLNPPFSTQGLGIWATVNNPLA